MSENFEFASTSMGISAPTSQKDSIISNISCPFGSCILKDKKLIKDFKDYLVLQGKSPRTVFTLSNRLCNICDALEVLDEESFKEFVIEKRLSGITNMALKKYIQAMDHYFKWQNIAWKQRPSAGTEEENPRPPFLPEEMKRIIDLPAPELPIIKGMGHHKLVQHQKSYELYTLYYQTIAGTGGRPTEVKTLEPHDIDIIQNTITFNALKTKTKRTRVIPVSSMLIKLLQKRLNNLNEPLFPFTTDSAGIELTRRCERLGIIKGKRSLYSFRSGFATDLDDNGASLNDIRALLGHKRVTTTQRYIHTSVKKLRKSVNKLTINRDTLSWNEFFELFVEEGKRLGILDNKSFDFIIQSDSFALWRKGKKKVVITDD